MSIYIKTLLSFFQIYIFKTFYLFVFRGGEERGRNTKCERNIYRLPLARPQGPGLQLSHVPWPGIEPATFRFARQRSTH